MLTYLVRRVGYALVLVVLVSFVGFLIIELPPGDFLTQKLAELQSRGDRSAELRIAEYRARYGLDKPLLTRYWIWATHFIRGDFGESFKYERPVKDLLKQRLMLTAVLAIATLAITWIIAIPLGVYSAVNQYSVGDQIVTTISFIGLGMPGSASCEGTYWIRWASPSWRPPGPAASPTARSSGSTRCAWPSIH
jgi:peptide/nickel transport system permease protein